MNTVIVLYPGFAATDALGPYEVLSRLPSAKVTFVAEQAGPVSADTGMLRVVADAAYEAIAEADILVVPGAPNRALPLLDHKLLSWLQAIDRSTKWTCSVCTGALILGAAGLLSGRRATTHWSSHHELARYGAEPKKERVVFDGKLVTGAGVTAGYDLALRLTDRIAGPLAAQAIQLGLEYAPEPPYDCGSPDKAPMEVLTVLAQLMGADALPQIG